MAEPSADRHYSSGTSWDYVESGRIANSHELPLRQLAPPHVTLTRVLYERE